MELKDFVINFESQLEDLEPGSLDGSCIYKELEEWDSMMALVIISMIDRVYNKQITGDDLKNTTTIEELFNIVRNR